MITLLNYWQEITATVGIFGAFIFGRKSAKILERKNNADAVTAMQTTYDIFLKHYKEQYEQLIERLNKLELRNAILLESSKEWETKFRDLEKSYEKLKMDFENYKKQHEQ